VRDLDPCAIVEDRRHRLEGRLGRAVHRPDHSGYLAEAVSYASVGFTPAWEDPAMRITLVLTALQLAACARNSDTEAGRERLRDTTLTPADTLAPEDTLDRARPAIPDTTGAPDTTSRR
jgi:hypothetical protein